MPGYEAYEAAAATVDNSPSLAENYLCMLPPLYLYSSTSP